MSSAHSPLLHNSWFAHFFSQWSVHISVSCEHCSRNVSKCSGYRSTLIQTKHIVQSHIHPNAYSCHCPPKSVASSMISPLSWILGNGILFLSLSAPTIGNYQNFNAGSSMGKLYFNRCPFFPSSSFECSLLYSLLLWHSAALFCFALLPSTLLPYMLCCFYSALTFLQPSTPAAASGSYALHTILSREVVFFVWEGRPSVDRDSPHNTPSSSYTK